MGKQMEAIDVLAVIDSAASDAEKRGEDATARVLFNARTTIAELIEASAMYFDGYCQDEADDWFSGDDPLGQVTGCSREQQKAATRLASAIDKCGTSHD